MAEKIKEDKGGRTLLTMKIPLQAELKGGFAKLKSLLANYPNLAALSEGTELKYATKYAGQLCTFTFGRSYIVEEISSAGSPVYVMREALLRMMGMIAYLGEIYSVKIESIFPYITAELASRQIEREIPRPITNRDSDIILAKRIIHLSKSLENSREQNSLLQQREYKLLLHLIIAESSNGALSVRELSKIYDVEEASLQAALKLAASYGYQIIEQGREKIALVKQ